MRSGDLVNSIMLISQVVLGYVFFGKILLFVLIVGKMDLDDVSLVGKVWGELQYWFGQLVNEWDLLDICEVVYVFFVQWYVQYEVDLLIGEGFYVIGDYFMNGFINVVMCIG